MPEMVGLPKAEVVARTLEREIREGRFGHGTQLDSEGGLMRRFDVSRNTVRRGLEILARQGLITTRTGIGSFVTYDGTTIDSSLGWSVALSHASGAVSTRLIDLSRGPCATADARLGTPHDYLRIDRVRICDGIGISLERSRLPWRAAFAQVLQSGLTNGSLNLTLGALGLAAAKGQEVASVLPALSAKDAALMQRPAGTPMLRLERVTQAADGAALEVVESLLDPARFGLRIDF
jgi:GntR family transcriptional regulator